ncbi:MAG: hypothetical protein K0R57_1911 [Paenibacillaceae bacterium]|jgi:rhamnogalacturonyl hydrolase YesR|nr:hypothetical protein [Paenibacillaceae bacterium]
MPHYFDPEQSMDFRAGSEPSQVLEKIASRYTGNHPAVPFAFRAYSRHGFRQRPDARFDLNLGEKYPEAGLGQYAYAFAKLWSGTDSAWEAAISCYGPVRLHVNGQQVYRSEIADEVNINNRRSITIPLKQGWNALFFTMCKTASGFGCIFGTIRSKWGSPVFLSPFAERSGQAGWICSELTDTDWFAGRELPDPASLEEVSGLQWYPRRSWSTEEQGQSVGKRLFGGAASGDYAYGWTRLLCSVPGYAPYDLQLRSQGAATVWVDGKECVKLPGAGQYRQKVELSYGSHEVLVKFEQGGTDWGFSLEWIDRDGRICLCEQPHRVHGTERTWFYLGPVSKTSQYSPEELQTLYGLWERETGGIYWQLDEPGAAVRAFLENINFARWNYPLGVTLYGLLQTGRRLSRPDICQYVDKHISLCTRMYAYSLWEKQQYGFTSINYQLADMDMLDDCGSFASAMLEAYSGCREPAALEVAKDVADFMMNRQERKADGVFYRASPGYFMENTLWGDDLYMSIPFLIRYARLTGENRYLDEAAKQFMLFKQYLYMPGQRIMSHVYDFKYNTATMVPWGRGNGWPIFSLSELLEALPQEHPNRQELEVFFNEFASGLLELQGENGLWHQVLTDSGSYEETSCTAMFVYAYCRGVRLGLLKDRENFVEAARRGWTGLTRYAVDQWGNVHGVCRGSRYSFTPSYYKDDLKWLMNDAHGIGIVMLAGIEYDALQAELRLADR